MTWLLKVHHDLPPGVPAHPTRRGQQRFELLQVFNLVLAGYILIHKLLVPGVVYGLQIGGAAGHLDLGVWYVYHFALALLLWARFRRPHRAYWVIYLAWYAAGYLPLAVFNSFWVGGEFQVAWKAISGLLCYGSSLVFTGFLLYRMRMPTTAFLFGLPDRILPRWRYALPYFAAGLVGSLLTLDGLRPASTAPVAGPPSRPPARRSLYE